MFRPILLMFAILVAFPLQAQDGDEIFLFGNDAYLAGRTVTLTQTDRDDLFAAGERVRTDAALTGNAHMAGRRLLVNEEVGGSLYAFGQTVDVMAPVAGDVTTFGQDIRIEAPIGGDLRAAGQNVEIVADIGEDLLVGGETVLLDGMVSGDVSIGAETITWGDSAVIEGTLTIYSDAPDTIDVPDSVISADRVSFEDPSTWEDRPGMDDVVDQSWSGWLKRWFSSIVAVTAVATLVAWLFPNFLSGLRERALERPVRALWIGFLGMSATIGSLVMFALTGIGIVLAPLSIIGAILLGFAGYVAGAYVLGVALMRLANQPLPGNLPERAIAAFIGALAAAVVSLVPVLGWIFALGLAVLGAGALLIRWFAPGFYAARA